MDQIVLQYLQNKLNLEASAVREEFGTEADKKNPPVFVSLNYDEILTLQQLVNDKIGVFSSKKKELPFVE